MPSTALKYTEFQHIAQFNPASNSFIQDIETAAANHIKHVTGLMHCTFTVQAMTPNVAIAAQSFRFTCNPDFDSTALKAHLRAP